MTNEKLQAMLNYLTSLPQDKIQEVRLGWEVLIGRDDAETRSDIVPKLVVLFKD